MMTSIIYQILADHISIERVDLLGQLVDYTINVLSNQDEQVCTVECLNSLNTLAKNGKGGKPRSCFRQNNSSDNTPADSGNAGSLITDRVGLGVEHVVFEERHIAADSAKYQSTLEKIITHVCCPIFKSTNLERNVKLTTSASGGGLDVFHATCKLCLTCLSMTNNSRSIIIYDACVGSLQAYVGEHRFSGNIKSLPLDRPTVIPIYPTLEILSTVFENVVTDDGANEGQRTSRILLPGKDWLDACFLELLNVIEHGEDAVCGQVATILIPKILKCCEATDKKVLILWERIKLVLSSNHYIENDANSSNNCFIILCAFIDYFHPNAGLLDQPDILSTILSENLFWEVIQNGFSKGDSLTRKRALYLLKRAVELSEGLEMLGGDSAGGIEIPLFHWSLQNKAALIKLWSDMILILETLEEIQIHVVMPVLTRISKLIEATYLPSSGWPLLHTSWLVVIFERLFQHATKTISRWSVMQVMGLDLRTCPILTQVGSKFVLGPVLHVLSDYTLYIKTTEKTQSRFSDVTELILGFFSSCVSSLPADQAKVFLQEILSAIVELRTKPIPLGFLCQSLARVPPCKAWGNSSMKCLRDLLSSGISTITPLHRGAIQCFLIDSALNLMDPADISLRQLGSTLAVLNRDECIRRGTILWEKIVNWLQLNASELKLDSRVQNLFEAVQLEVTEYLTISHTDGTPTASSAKEATKVARMLLLIVDANCRAKEQLLGGQSLSDLVQPLTMLLQIIGSHIYLPVAKADKALELLSAILDEADPKMKIENDLMTDLEKSVFRSKCIEEIFFYLSRRLCAMDETESKYENSLPLYISILDRLLHYHPGNPIYPYLPGNLVSTCLLRLLGDCINIVTRPPNLTTQHEVLSFIVNSRLLGWMMSSATSSSLVINTNMLITIGSFVGPMEHSSGLVDVFVKCAHNVVKFGDTLGSTDRGSLISTFLSSKWSIILYLLQRHSSEIYASSSPEDILTACLSDLSIMQGLEVIPVMQCVKHFVAKVVCNPSCCIEALDICWNVVRDSENGQKVYWACLETFIQIAFQVDLMKSDSDTLIGKLKEIANDFFVAGEKKQGLANVLANQMCGSLLALAKEDAHVCISTTLKYLDVLLSFYLFCPSLNKDIRLQQDVSASIVEMGDKCSVNQVFKSCNRDNRLVRVIAINLIVKLRADYPDILQELAPRMIDSLLQREKEASRKKYVCNSDRHRLKEKIWQTILLLLPCVQLETARIIFPPILNCLVMDNQPSVKYFQEWVLIVLMDRFPLFQKILWCLFKQATQTDDWNRNQMCSLLTILTHLGTIMADKQQKAAFHQQALPLVLSFCLSKNFSIQLYAQASLSKLWAECESSGLEDVIAMYPAVAACVQFQNCSSVHFSILDRLQANFFLLKFHPQHDCNFETIFYTIPYLTLMMPDQLIPADMFIEENAALWARSDLSHSLRAPCDRQGLRELGPGTWKATRVKHNHQKVGEEGSFDAATTDDVQKKIIPTGESIPGLDVDTIQRKNQNRSKLILVASLVSKVPNLGGLCRTSEIFGVGTIVMPNRLLTETKEFQNLSVTAHKWLNIEEVRPYDLKEYLMKRRHDGYLLVGLEQTANSKCLIDCKFPPETLILLGNERSGIPVELINILDVCIEIPQLGMLRSLNVHVSGALAVWEYTKQCMMS